MELRKTTKKEEENQCYRGATYQTHQSRTRQDDKYVKRVLGEVSNIRVRNTKVQEVAVRRGKLAKIYNSSRIPSSIPCLLTAAISEVLLVVELPEGVEDIDTKSDVENDRIYAKEIMAYMTKLEELKRLSPDLVKKSSVSPRIRVILIDWLIQVQHYLRLNQETLYLTTYLFDHFCTRKSVPIEQVQLLLISCLLIACKVEERFLPELKTLTHLSEDFYVPNQIIRMEQSILKTLQFQLVMPDPMVFLHRCIQASGIANKQLEHLSTFVVDVCLSDPKMINIPPSKVMAGAFCLAKKILLKGDEAKWTKTLEHYSGYKESTLLELMIFMTDAISSSPASQEQGARKKYASQSRYGGLSELPVLSPNRIRTVVGPQLREISAL